MADTELRKVKHYNGCIPQCSAVVGSSRCTNIGAWQRFEGISGDKLKQVIVCLCEKHAKDAGWPIGKTGEE
jgi:hypothetical protein